MKQIIKKYISILKGNAKHLYDGKINISKYWYGNSYGGFYIAPQFLNEKSVILSFGIGEDISFDLEIINQHNCIVYGFDPTPKSVNWINNKKNKISNRFKFYEYGIAEKTGFVDFFLPKNTNNVSGSFVNQINVNKEETIEVLMKSYSDICTEFNFKHVDVLKMDIEGAEYLVIENILNSEIMISQILVEFHDRFFSDGMERTKKTISLLKSKGYLVFGVSKSLEEISFIHRSVL